MIPGGRLNEKSMRMMMRRMGMSTTPVEGVVEVVIRRERDEIVLRQPEVTEVVVQGVRTYQVVGTPETRPRTPSGEATGGPTPAPAPAPPPGPPEEDIRLVMEQAQVDRAQAVEALKAANGEPAEAILRILSRRGA